jgi:hypothetical protein
MAAIVTLLRKSLHRGRGPHRIRAIVSVAFGTDVSVQGAYQKGTGFLNQGATPIDFQSVIPEPIVEPTAIGNGYVGSMIEPRMVAKASFTGFTTGFTAGSTHGILDFDLMGVLNYSAPPHKYVFVRYYGCAAGPGPVFDEAASDASITGGGFSVELEYTPISGGEA